jgi:hypothetical protein
MDWNVFVSSLNDKERLILLQLLTKDESQDYTDILEWCERLHGQNTMTTRLRNIIIWGYRSGNTVEEVTMESFLKKKNAGVKAWIEFMELRGY